MSLLKDPTNKIKSEVGLLTVWRAGRRVLELVAQQCDLPPLQLVSVTALLGSLQPASHLTMLPGMVPLTLFFMALSLTADLLVTEVEGGMLARDWTMGVSTLHSLLCQVTVQLTVVILQVLSSVTMMAILYSLSASLTLAVASLLLLHCVCGMMWGIVISLTSNSRSVQDYH